MLRPFFCTLLASSPFLATPQQSSLPHLAWGDFDGDGLDDLVAVEPTGRLRLYKNLGAGTLEEVTDVSGLAGPARSASWQDVDRDRALDLLLVRPDGSCSLYKNQGAGQFVTAAGTDGLERARACTDASWIDLDGDGDADLELRSPQGVELLRNDGRGAFEQTPLVWSTSLENAASAPLPLAAESASPGTPASDSTGPALGGATPAAPKTGAPAAAPSASASRGSSGISRTALGSGADPALLGSGRYELPEAASAICVVSVEDDSAPGSCLRASSVPALGMLFPLSEELFVSSSGMIGCGTLTPRSQLHVKGPANQATLRLNTQSNDGTSKLLLLENNNPDTTLVGGQLAYDGPLDALRLSTFTAGVELTRMVVERPTGDVGIGTTNPVTDLHVVGSTSLGSVLISPNGAGGSDSELVLSEDNTGSTGMKLVCKGANDRLEVRGLANGIETALMAVERGGQVGIGTTTPTKRLHVIGTADVVTRLESNATAGSRLEIANTDTGGRAWDIGVTGSTATAGAGKLLVRDATAGNAARLSIDTVGNVGINTFSPEARLHVVGDALITGEIGGDSQLGLSGDGINGPDILLDGSGTVGIGGGGVVYSDVTLNIQANLGDDQLLNVELRDGTDVFEVQDDSEVFVVGDFFVIGAKNFILDHPLDPANKSLAHNAVEGPGYYTFYRGNAVLDAAGEAWVELPDYFDALNADASYQLTCVGGSAAVYVADEVRANRFRIAGGYPGLKVSWQVTAERDDPYARAHPYRDEIEKSEKDRGFYYYPAGYGLPRELGLATRPQAVPEKREKAPATSPAGR